MTPPTLAQIQHYKLEINDTFIDPEYFLAHYTENGWMRGKNPVKNWKLTYQLWHRKAEKNPQPSKVYSEMSLDEYVNSLL